MIVRPSEIERPSPEERRRMQEIPPARLTVALLASIAVAFAAQLAAGLGDDNPYVYTRMGANLTSLVAAGEWDRLITANWLHAGWIHVIANSVGLVFMGLAIERLLGSSRFFVIYTVSCLAGALASTLSDPGTPSLGASTGVVGLFASLGYILFRFRAALPAFAKSAMRQWVLLLLLNVAIAFAFSDLGIDHWGHGGGFAGGVAATVLLTVGWPPLMRKRSSERVTRAVAFFLSALFAAGLVISIQRWASLDRSGDYAVALAAAESEDPNPHLLNAYAWFVAIDPQAERRTLELSAEMADRAIELLPEEDDDPRIQAMIADTLATAHYRLGNHDLSVEIQRVVFEQQPEPVYGSQLARFLHARVEADGPIVLPEEGPRLELELDQLELAMDVEGNAPDGFVFYAVVTARDGSVLGLIHGRSPAGTSPPSTKRLGRPWPAGAQARVALVDAGAPVGGEAFTVSTVRIVPEVAGYP